MKTWARWTLLILYIGLLMLSAAYWNPFASLPALLKFSVITVLSAALFGLLVILMQFYILLSIIFPLPPRADAKAPKSILKRAFKFLYKPSPINPKAPQYLDEMIGNEMAKVEIKEAIDILKKAKNYEESGAQVPKGMLFVGPPGVGKTLFARAIANEVGMPFYVIEGGAISGLIMGLGVLKLKTLFRKLQRHDTAILFIDEIESMCAKRQQDRGFGGQADMNMTLNTLLTEMDGFHGSRLIVIGATNNDGMLDPALMRAGRMDRRIYFQMPTIEERANLFRFYLGKVLTDETDLDVNRITELTANYSPAEIAGVVNEAALISRRPGNPGKVNTEMVLQALDRVSVGLERSITNSNVSLINHDPTIRFDAVLGMDEVKKEVT
ncbi:MAG: family ATPase, partial [Cyanobacteriota bacterium erpe_2018_sw_39hr_WHONDRS-SW48-000098_B_bin.30]|nr:family ATPase [Cyanobacteriota bacterium erpe_2018_sw_39hr_WHONDRS-SW48-000098_B_bin.30]